VSIHETDVAANNSVRLYRQAPASFAVPPGGRLALWISTVAEGAKIGFFTPRVLSLRAMLVPKVHWAFER